MPDDSIKSVGVLNHRHRDLVRLADENQIIE